MPNLRHTTEVQFLALHHDTFQLGHTDCDLLRSLLTPYITGKLINLQSDTTASTTEYRVGAQAA